MVDGRRSVVEAATKAPSTALGFRLAAVVIPVVPVVALIAVAGDVDSCSSAVLDHLSIFYIHVHTSNSKC